MHRLYDIFCKMFPDFASQISKWGPHNSNTIRLETRAHQLYYFTYSSDKEWCLGTMKKKENK